MSPVELVWAKVALRAGGNRAFAAVQVVDDRGARVDGIGVGALVGVCWGSAHGLGALERGFGVGDGGGGGGVLGAAGERPGACEEARLFARGRGEGFIGLGGGGDGGVERRGFVEDCFRVFVLEDALDDVVDVEGHGLVLVLQGLELALELAVLFGLGGLCGFFELLGEVGADGDGVAGRALDLLDDVLGLWLDLAERVGKVVAAGKVAVEGGGGKEELEALVVLHKAGVGHAGFEELLLELLELGAALVVGFREVDLGFGELETEGLDELVFLEEEVVVALGGGDAV